MREMMKWLVVGALMVLLSACGGGGTPQNDGDDSNGTTADTTPPTFTSPTTVTVAENQTNALTLQATDASTPITYSMSGGDGSSFTVDSVTGVVTFNTAPDYEIKTSYTFTATVTDAQGNSATQSVTVAISDVDEIAPTFTSPTTVTVAENQTNALTLQATDASRPITYSMSGGDSSSFTVDSATGVVTFETAPDFETKDAYGFTAKATDAVGNEATQDITIHISDLPEGQAPKKTGQTKSYDASGTEVTDGSIKDDGFYQKGIAPSYTRDDANNIVTDHITGLQWQDDANVSTVTKLWLTQTNYDICRGQNGQTQDTSKCTDTSGDTAVTYCSSLTLGGFADWRLPSIDELMYIADRSKRNPAIDTSYFTNVVSSYYWSSTTVVGYEYDAWRVYFGGGYDGWSYKSNSRYVRCVRDGQ